MPAHLVILVKLEELGLGFGNVFINYLMFFTCRTTSIQHDQTAFQKQWQCARTSVALTSVKHKGNRRHVAVEPLRLSHSLGFFSFFGSAVSSLFQVSMDVSQSISPFVSQIA